MSWPFLAAKITFSATFATFAFFFLMAYRNSVNQIRFYRNEISNLTIWNKATRLALLNDVAEAPQYMIEALLKTERNFVLKRGETTTETQLHAFEARIAADLLKSAPQNNVEGGKK